ncbi:MAG: hypothetical protein AAGF31_11855 [Planctomycetota bacterium]
MSISTMQLARFGAVLLFVAGMIAATGCHAWPDKKWDASSLRDPRATDLERRLSAQPTAVENPFGRSLDDREP